jgi:PTH1 family peptidyl-tRNA hydrolase
MARFKFGGGHGGHNGLRDTITHCGPDFWRLRIGIGHPGDRDQVIDYVLQRAAPDDEEAIAGSVGAALDALPVFLGDGAEKAMNLLHTKGSDQ